MTHPFPHRYQVALNWKNGPAGTLLSSPRPAIVVGKPPEFDGSDAWWSPEHLLLGAAASCLMTTYLAIAERSRLKTAGYRCEAAGTLDKTEQGFRFTEVRLKVAVEVDPSDAERAERLLQSAKKHCIVANSLACPVELEASANTAAAPRPSR